MKTICTLITLLCSLVTLSASDYVLLDSPYADHKIEMVVHHSSTQQSPLLIFLHGASFSNDLQHFLQSCLNPWVEKGFSVAAISMPGYGNSTGRKDFCGPRTMHSLNVAIDAIKESLHVSTFGMIGFGQGGLASVLLASQRTDIRCVVCANGGYDFERHKTPEDILMTVLRKNDYDFDIQDVNALEIRSATAHISTINAPLYLLHRKGNPVINEGEAIDFYQAMIAAGKECYLSLKDKTPESDAQRLSYQEVLSDTEEWITCRMEDDKH
jgi:dipeptidyl aminopeptidase/acylaminoacyl peptidase